MKILKLQANYWGRDPMDGGLLTATVKAKSGHEAVDYAQGVLGVQSYRPGAYFCEAYGGFKHTKRREYIVELRFGWDV